VANRGQEHANPVADTKKGRAADCAPNLSLTQMGTTVIELARNGADVASVVNFPGGLDSPHPADGQNIKCQVVARHDADAPPTSSEAGGGRAGGFKQS